jgi:transcriptional regulator with XRE-family HTH domain
LQHESEVHLERNFTQNPAPTGGNLVQPAWQTVIELRSRRGWTQEKLAEKSILSVRTIQNLERGKAAHLGTITKIADALGVPPRECIASATPLQQLQNGQTHEAGASLPPCPYRGLLAFREEDAELFFGREALIDLLTEKLAHKNMIQVSGCSGSGKSSLISAGLIPALKGAGSWQVLYCRPGSDPFGALASALMPQLEPRLDVITRADQLPRLHVVMEQGQLPYLLTQIGSRQ